MLSLRLWRGSLASERPFLREDRADKARRFMGETACKRAKIDLWYHDWGYTSTLHILGEEPTHLGPQDRLSIYLSIRQNSGCLSVVLHRTFFRLGT